MKEIRILHLFPKLLSLYGEYGNVAVLRRALENMGNTVTVDTYENGELILNEYDFIYVGAGTEDNLMEAIRRLIPHQDAIVESINRGDLWLATGNAMTLFGASVMRNQAEMEALSCFDYDTHIFDTKRYLGDVLTEDGFVGFVNTSCLYGSIRTPLLQLKLNPQLGNDKACGADGIHEKNFYGTQLIGPVLVKNPHFLEMICQAITGEEVVISAESNAKKAYAIALKELKNRLQ